jgi:hypothetical protein
MLEIVKYENELYYREVEKLGVGSYKKKDEWKKVEEKDISKELEEQK